MAWHKQYSGEALSTCATPSVSSMCVAMALSSVADWHMVCRRPQTQRCLWPWLAASRSRELHAAEEADADSQSAEEERSGGWPQRRPAARAQWWRRRERSWSPRL